MANAMAPPDMFGSGKRVYIEALAWRDPPPRGSDISRPPPAVPCARPPWSQGQRRPPPAARASDEARDGPVHVDDLGVAKRVRGVAHGAGQGPHRTAGVGEAFPLTGRPPEGGASVGCSAGRGTNLLCHERVATRGRKDMHNDRRDAGGAVEARQITRNLRKSCAPHIPERYPQRTLHAPESSNNCRTVVEMLPPRAQI